jgi:hypothetical protein
LRSQAVQKANDLLGQKAYLALKPLLMQCISEGNHEALLAVKLLADTRGTGVRENAFYSLLAWQEAGLETMLDLALTAPFPHNLHLACDILSSIAIGEMPSFKNAYQMEGWQEEVTKRFQDASVFTSKSENILRKLILSLDEGDIDHLPSVLGCRFWFQNPKKLRLILSIASLRWIAVGNKVIDDYLQLIAGSMNEEHLFQQFFQQNPLLLDPLAHRVWPKPDLHGKKEPDFIIQRTDNTYIVVEIETPGKAIVTKDGQMSAKVTQAVTQAMEYRSFLIERYQQARSTFPGFNSPEALIVVGLEGILSSEEREALRRENEHRAHLRIVGFDALAERARAISSNMVEGRVIVERNVRLS